MNWRKLLPVVAVILAAAAIGVLAFLVRKTQTVIALLLMDQSVVSGIGNIYANEALFLARIHPARRANTVIDRTVDVTVRSAAERAARQHQSVGNSERRISASTRRGARSPPASGSDSPVPCCRR